MTDDSLARAFQGIPSRSIVVLEDIDVAMAKTRTLPTENEGQKSDAPTPATPRTPSTHKSGISLSALLNGVDGVGAGEGRIMVRHLLHISYM
jgi:chaperone BCS1